MYMYIYTYIYIYIIIYVSFLQVSESLYVTPNHMTLPEFGPISVSRPSWIRPSSRRKR